MLMSIHSPLPALGKRVFVFQKFCPPWASDLLFHFALARCEQVICFLSLPLPDVGKLFVFSVCLCLMWASDLFSNFAFAHIGQARFRFKTSLPKLGKGIFDLFHHFFAFLASRFI